MIVQHLGHSCFKVSIKDYTFLLDPWLNDLAFFKSWLPLSKIDPAQLGKVDFIYFSHEHPDHFHPSSVKKI
jgi:UDP-MurNAc hydroxylase